MAMWTDQVALVTGAGSGIGRAAALAFGAEGARVMVCDLHAASAQQTALLLREAGGHADCMVGDVSSAAKVQQLVSHIVGKYGRLDFAFNNAGIEGAMADTAECTEENWDRTLAVNLKSIWLCMKYELQHMRERGAGVIVNCSSVAGLVGFPQLPAYVASKHGVVGLTRAAALEYAKRGIRINAVCPGVIHTAMVDRLQHEHPGLDLAAGEPIGRMGTPDEVAGAVIWLCSDRATFVTGQAIAVDGGWLAQ